MMREIFICSVVMVVVETEWYSDVKQKLVTRDRLPNLSSRTRERDCQIASFFR